VSWEWTDDANRQPMALGREELAEVINQLPVVGRSDPPGHYDTSSPNSI
jgi:hypothetical protein